MAYYDRCMNDFAEKSRCGKVVISKMRTAGRQRIPWMLDGWDCRMKWVRWVWFSISVWGIAGIVSCDSWSTNTVVISAEEFRFDPKFIDWPSLGPVHVILKNRGRERHVFQSPSMFSAGEFEGDLEETVRFKQERAIMLEPGGRVEFVVRLPPGTYPFRCWVKGHTGMEGTIQVSGDRKER